MLNKLRVSTKIIIPIIFILAIGNILTTYLTTTQMHLLSKTNAENSLNMLTDSIFLTLRNAMNTGDPSIIQKAENDSRKVIKGLENLKVEKSEKTIALYSPGTQFTTDPDILKTFQTKKEKVIDIHNNDSHSLRVLRPMIAGNECLMCHSNQKEGDVIGVIDLTFSLNNSDTMIDNTLSFIVTISTIFIVLTLLVIWFVAKKATEPLKKLKGELKQFFSFLANERDTLEPFKVHSEDEIGEMIITLNENIDKTIQGLQKDAQVISEVGEVCKQAAQGDVSVKINTQANNPEINNLTKIVNELLNSMNVNIHRVLNILDAYSSDEYSKRIHSNDATKAQMKKLFDQVDFLGDTLTRLSSQNLKNGKALQQTSKILADKITTLAATSKEQAKSVNETAESLQDIVQNIEKTSQNSKEMKSHANEVIQFSSQGLKLATQTSESMKEINGKVNSINEAITVIDQIAFQTNILSLNAAVEAATAGEAGKGFAVVAGEVRNLANRSAEAANEIKALVENATSQADQGNTIATQMIQGYETLNESINATTTLIESVSQDTNLQQEKVSQINSAIAHIDQSTQRNANIAQETNIVAQQASDIAQKIVEDAGGKNFEGKNDIKIRKKIIDPNYKGPERRKIEKMLKSSS